MALASLAWSGALTDAPDFRAALARAAHLNLAEALLLIWTVLVTGLILQPLQLFFVQLFEGYWGVSGLATKLASRRVMAHQKHRRRLDRATSIRRAGRAGAEEATWRLRHQYPRTDRVLPTKLGNVLRAAEDRAGQRYGLNTVLAWSRLYPLVPDPLAGMLADQRNQLDVAVRLCLVFVLVALTYLTMYLRHVPTLVAHPTHYGIYLLGAIFIVSLVVACASYLGGVAAAESYGIGMETAFDLHRFALLRSLHLPLPSHRADEYADNMELSDFLLRAREFLPGLKHNFSYKHEDAANR